MRNIARTAHADTRAPSRLCTAQKAEKRRSLSTLRSLLPLLELPPWPLLEAAAAAGPFPPSSVAVEVAAGPSRPVVEAVGVGPSHPVAVVGEVAGGRQP
jgi:hypothetical protein